MKVTQDELEITICAEAVERVSPFAILEIGSAFGGTLAFWLGTGGRHVVSVDVDHGTLDWSMLEQFAMQGSVNSSGDRRQ